MVLVCRRSKMSFSAYTMACGRIEPRCEPELGLSKAGLCGMGVECVVCLISRLSEEFDVVLLPELSAAETSTMSVSGFMVQRYD